MIDCNEQLPNRKTKVLLLTENPLGNYRTMLAQHVAPNEYGLDPDGYITEDRDEFGFTLPPGWHEVTELCDCGLSELPGDWRPVAWVYPEMERIKQ